MSKEVAFDQSSVGLKTLISEGKTKQIYSLQSLPNQKQREIIETSVEFLEEGHRRHPKRLPSKTKEEGKKMRERKVVEEGQRRQPKRLPGKTKREEEKTREKEIVEEGQRHQPKRLPVLNKYEQVCNLMDSSLCATPTTQVFIVAGSPADLPHCQKISEKASKLGLCTRTHVCSAHKAPLEVLSLSAAAMTGLPTVLIAVAGRSNGLGPVLAGSSPLPVINCPPPNEQWLDKDIWSSLRMPSGMGCVTVLDPEEAALAAAKMLALRDHIVFGHIIGEQLRNYMKIYNAEETVRSLACTDELK